MFDIEVMPAIPNVNVPLRSPHRPTPKFFVEAKTFSTKKERGNTPRSNQYPRPPIKSCPPISRVFHHCHSTQSPRIVSFKQSNDESLSPIYDSSKRELYFHQCFSIEKKLGAGSFGDVYQVRSKENGHQYAVKRSRERFKGDLDRRRKLEEVSKHELLPGHSNCVRFYKAWEERHRLYIQTELCETSLADLSESEHEIPERLIWNYLIDLLMAVKHLHNHDLLHMDIKPENIFIAKDGTCQLGDFGLILDLSKSSDLSEAQEGDPKYLAPELMDGRFTKAADIFSLGITILELACDLDLPRGDDGWHQLRSGRLPEHIVKDRLSVDLESVILLMMDPSYKSRPSAEALLNLPIIKRVQRYNAIYKIWCKQREAVAGAMLGVWCYFVQLLSLVVGLVLPARYSGDEPDDDIRGSRSSHSDVAVDSSWDSSGFDDDVFADPSVPQLLEFSWDSNESEDLCPPVPAAPKALTTGARRRPVKTARILGAVESPTKTPSQGSPMLMTASRSSRLSVVLPSDPSSTTPPSCRKKMLFEDEDRKTAPIGPKNLMSAFDTAETDEEDMNL